MGLEVHVELGLNVESLIPDEQFGFPSLTTGKPFNHAELRLARPFSRPLPKTRAKNNIDEDNIVKLSDIITAESSTGYFTRISGNLLTQLKDNSTMNKTLAH